MLTPHLIHPNFWAQGSRRRRVGNVPLIRCAPISELDKQWTRKWCARQLEQLKHNPSNAVIK